jgi:hypothetical protein
MAKKSQRGRARGEGGGKDEFIYGQQQQVFYFYLYQLLVSNFIVCVVCSEFYVLLFFID